MWIKVRLFANLREYVPQAKIGTTLDVEIPYGSSVLELANHFRLPLDLVKLAYVNGIYQELDFVLQENDEIGLFPPIGGG